LQLKCAHLVSVKAPLSKEAIFNRNKAAAERRRAARKAQHKEREIAKHDQNDNHIKRWKAWERGVSSNEDPSPESSWSGDVASAAVVTTPSEMIPYYRINHSIWLKDQMATREGGE
jgi:hypothetical protein